MNQILILYKSQTGFTKQYAEWIAAETGGDLLEFKAATPDKLSGYDKIVFGSRLHAGRIDGYPAMKRLFAKAGSTASFVLFAVGAMPGADMPGSDKAAISQVWETNLTIKEREIIPCFYLPGGLRYERMSFLDRWMMKLASFFIIRSEKKNKKQQNPQETFTQMISSSYDISSKAFIKPLVTCLTTP